MPEPRIGIYPGTFDPLTNGHMDIISRATKIVDRLIIGVAEHTGKDTLFTLDERLAMVREEVELLGDGIKSEVEVCSFNSLLMEFAPDMGLDEVPDPYYGNLPGFERVYDILDHGLRGLLGQIRRDLAERSLEH